MWALNVSSRRLSAMTICSIVQSLSSSITRDTGAAASLLALLDSYTCTSDGSTLAPTHCQDTKQGVASVAYCNVHCPEPEPAQDAEVPVQAAPQPPLLQLNRHHQHAQDGEGVSSRQHAGHVHHAAVSWGDAAPCSPLPPATTCHNGATWYQGVQSSSERPAEQSGSDLLAQQSGSELPAQQSGSDLLAEQPGTSSGAPAGSAPASTSALPLHEQLQCAAQAGEWESVQHILDCSPPWAIVYHIGNMALTAPTLDNNSLHQCTTMAAACITEKLHSLAATNDVRVVSTMVADACIQTLFHLPTGALAKPTALITFVATVSEACIGSAALPEVVELWGQLSRFGSTGCVPHRVYCLADATVAGHTEYKNIMLHCWEIVNILKSFASNSSKPPACYRWLMQSLCKYLPTISVKHLRRVVDSVASFDGLPNVAIAAALCDACVKCHARSPLQVDDLPAVLKLAARAHNLHGVFLGKRFLTMVCSVLELAVVDARPRVLRFMLRQMRVLYQCPWPSLRFEHAVSKHLKALLCVADAKGLSAMLAWCCEAGRPPRGFDVHVAFSKFNNLLVNGAAPAQAVLDVVLALPELHHGSWPAELDLAAVDAALVAFMDQTVLADIDGILHAFAATQTAPSLALQHAAWAHVRAVVPQRSRVAGRVIRLVLFNVAQHVTALQAAEYKEAWHVVSAQFRTGDMQVFDVACCLSLLSQLSPSDPERFVDPDIDRMLEYIVSNPSAKQFTAAVKFALSACESLGHLPSPEVQQQLSHHALQGS